MPRQATTKVVSSEAATPSFTAASLGVACQVTSAPAGESSL
jgi:hypothetical protein